MMARSNDLPGRQSETGPSRRSSLLINIENLDDGLIDNEEFYQIYEENRDDAIRLVHSYHDMARGLISQLRADLVASQAIVFDLQKNAGQNGGMTRDDELNKLHEALKAKDLAMAQQKKLQIDLTRERDQYRDAFAKQSLLSLGTSAPAVAAASQKSCKLPDPKRFDNGVKEPKYEAWVRQIRDKLKNNADQFPTAGYRVAYVMGRLTGEASQRVLNLSKHCVVM